MNFKTAFPLALIFISSIVGAADRFIDTDYDCSRATGIRCGLFRRSGSTTLLIWRPEPANEETRKEWVHESQMIERKFELAGGTHVLVREINTSTGQLVERACQPGGCTAWNSVPLPEADPIALWEELSN